MVSKYTGLSIEPHSDDLLLERFAKGQSQEAFSALVERYALLVFATCWRRLDSVVLAEDASQAVFVLLARNAKRLTAPRTLAPWLYRMSVLVCKGLRHEEEKMARAAKALQESAISAPARDTTLSLTLDAALAKLAKKDREAIVMHYLQGLTLGELAESLGTSPDAARMRISRALKQLRPSLEGLGYAVATEELPSKLDATRIQVPNGLLPRLRAASSAPADSRGAVIATGISRMLLLSRLSFGIPAAAALVLAGHFASEKPAVKPLPSTSYHVVSYVVQPAGAPRDAGFTLHKTSEDWVEPDRQRITQYPYWKAGRIQSDYLLDLKANPTTVTVRSRRGDVLTITRAQALNGTQGGRWAQEPDLAVANSDFSKIENFWKSAVVTRLPRRKVSVFGKSMTVDPSQVTVHGFYRMTGYRDADSGRLVKQETYSFDKDGWYLIDFADFEYAPMPNDAFDSRTLAKTGQFEFGQLVKPAKTKP